MSRQEQDVSKTHSICVCYKRSCQVKEWDSHYGRYSFQWLGLHDFLWEALERFYLRCRSGCSNYRHTMDCLIKEMPEWTDNYFHFIDYSSLFTLVKVYLNFIQFLSFIDMWFWFVIFLLKVMFKSEKIRYILIKAYRDAILLQCSKILR